MLYERHLQEYQGSLTGQAIRVELLRDRPIHVPIFRYDLCFSSTYGLRESENYTDLRRASGPTGPTLPGPDHDSIRWPCYNLLNEDFMKVIE